MASAELLVKPIEAIRVAAIRDIVANHGSVGPLYEEIMVELEARGLTPTGPALAVYYDERYKEADIDVEAAIPVEASELVEGVRFQIRDLPAHERMACLMRRGPYDDFTPSYQTLMSWIEENGYRIIGPNREIYLRGPKAGLPPEEYVTEIQFPVAKAA